MGTKRALVLLVIVVLLASTGVLAWWLAAVSEELGDSRDGAAARSRELTEQVERLQGELSDLSDHASQLQRNLRRQHQEAATWRRAAEEAQAGTEHLLDALRHGYGFPVSESCSFPEVTSIEPRILRPTGGATVEGPVVVEIIGADPFWCDPTYFITVDGVPYDHGAPPKRGPSSTGNPRPTEARPELPRRRWTETCMSGSAIFLSFELEPGPHTIRVHGGCPQGTAVPATIPVQSTFTVGGT